MGRNRNRNKGRRIKEEKGRGLNDLRLNSATRSIYQINPNELGLISGRKRRAIEKCRSPAMGYEWLDQHARRR